MNRAPSVAVRVAHVTLVLIIVVCATICAQFAQTRIATATIPAGAAETAVTVTDLDRALDLVLRQARDLDRDDDDAEQIAPWADPRDKDDRELDLYGNDVSEAIAQYKLDADGSLYELHSPRTQLPRLSSPKS